MGCHLKDKKGTTITNAFQEILDEPGRKPSRDEAERFAIDQWNHGYKITIKNIFNT